MGNHGKLIKTIVDHLWAVFMENIWKRYFQIGGGIVLFLGAPVKSNSMDTNPENIDFHDVRIDRALGNPYL